MALNSPTLHLTSYHNTANPQKLSILKTSVTGSHLICSQSRKYSFSFPLLHIALISKSTRLNAERSYSQRFRINDSTSSSLYPAELASGGDGNNDGANGNDNNGGNNGGNNGAGGDGEGAKENDPREIRIEAIVALARLGKTLSDLPVDMAATLQEGRITGALVKRFFELEANPFFRWLLQFGGFRERLLADDLFLTKVAIECGVGIFTKTAAELERRREKFKKELDFVFADVVMALIADFMLVWLPAPTVSLRPIAAQAGGLAKFFYGCPDNAFQVAVRGTSYTVLQRAGAIVRNGAKLLMVGTSASLIGTGITNGLIYVRRAVDKDFMADTEDMPIFSTSLAYGVYMAVSSNLRYQILAGVIEQRILEPWLHNQKLALSAACFAVRTGNTFLGSLMWVDYARWVGVQKARE
ncbi:hypothetical protein KP509_29G029100 [Ceratopteris richardii]|uniref:Protein RETICULATA-RELATED 4, chloroplastic-like n=1 Tax=Ceratopteris richardii TaxID=49495 RepID=A0A8T2R7Z9_CERRI|nr:hypothetical protein KP509_29G029100 [Ceratopteris richardii]KAH7291696.1 hypothetical protein KP509_29G029100 [Ceratopteris richardii]KAH7291697.1 hypothetical protein KP509_29G029100 [Ceratopteris richardii]KAH7291698.1 hypothetical protein KP509_29G029100 [Ceratopteris richardii]